MKLPRVKFKAAFVISTLRVVLLLIILGGIIFAIWFIKFRDHKRQVEAPKPLTAKQVESRYSNQASSYLNSKAYDTYQGEQQRLAQQYLSSSDNNNAERVMLDVLNKVPEDKIIDTTYLTLINIEEAKHDRAKEKDYMQKLINVYNRDGDSKSAEIYQTTLSKL